MPSLHIKPIHHPTFEAEALLEGSEIAVRFTGTADLSTKMVMDSFLNEVHVEASRINVAKVNVDVSGLEFINSSCLMAIVTWITTVQTMANRRYLISFHFKSIRDWHRRTFNVLAEIGEGIVAVQPSPPDSQRPPQVPGAEPRDDQTQADHTTRMARPADGEGADATTRLPLSIFGHHRH